MRLPYFLLACALTLPAAACRRSEGGSTASADAGADAGGPADAGAGSTADALSPGEKACGNPAASPRQVAVEFLEASKGRDLQGMLACFKPKHRERMAGREARLEELTVISYELGEVTVDGDSAQVAATVKRYDGRGLIEHKRDPIRLEREGGIWYFR
ncbi:MAG TPA: hypothetical protein VLS89_05610 [Candidatus Nanopelagicales bacterium]|nr:hypothetical protein [Candidatus Nanopelagicales bacterium]